MTVPMILDSMIPTGLGDKSFKDLGRLDKLETMLVEKGKESK